MQFIDHFAYGVEINYQNIYMNNKEQLIYVESKKVQFIILVNFQNEKLGTEGKAVKNNTTTHSCVL